MPNLVLDASALLAYLFEETGHENVKPEGAALSQVNLSEVAQRLIKLGYTVDTLLFELSVLGIEIETFRSQDALNAALLYPQTKSKGLSLGDRACLATAQRLGFTALTADRAWAELDIGVDIRLIR